MQVDYDLEGTEDPSARVMVALMILGCVACCCISLCGYICWATHSASARVAPYEVPFHKPQSWKQEKQRRKTHAEQLRAQMAALPDDDGSSSHTHRQDKGLKGAGSHRPSNAPLVKLTANWGV